jgi:hypothetical protein
MYYNKSILILLFLTGCARAQTDQPTPIRALPTETHTAGGCFGAFDKNQAYWAGFCAPTGMLANQNWTLPAADGNSTDNCMGWVSAYTLAFVPCGSGAATLVLVTTDPSGSCSNPTPMQYNYNDGILWGCDGTTWIQMLNATGAQTVTGTKTFATTQVFQNSVCLDWITQGGTNVCVAEMSNVNDNFNIGPVTSFTDPVYCAICGSLELYANGHDYVELAAANGYFYPLSNSQFLGTSSHPWEEVVGGQAIFGTSSANGSVGYCNTTGGCATIWAPSSYTGSYGVNLPNSAPTAAGQVLAVQSTGTPAQLQWSASSTNITFVTTNPSGGCSNPTPLQYNTNTGALWGCDNGTWSIIPVLPNNILLNSITEGGTTIGILEMSNVNDNVNVGAVTAFTDPSYCAVCGSLELYANGHDYIEINAANGYMYPLTGGQFLGTSTHPWANIVGGQLSVGTSTTPGLVSIESYNGNGNFVNIFAGPNVSSTWEVYLPQSGPSTTGLALEVQSVGVPSALEWSPYPVVDTGGTFTMNGHYTIGNTLSTASILPSASNIFTLGGASNIWGSIYAINLYINGLSDDGAGNISITTSLIPGGGAYSNGTNSSPWNAVYANDLYSKIEFYTNTINPFSGSTITAYGNIYPSANNTYSLGALGQVWAGVAATTFAGTNVITSNLTVNTSITAGGGAGVTCSGAPTSSFATSLGIVTHC